MTLDETKWLLETLAARRGRLLFYYLRHGDPACAKDGVPTCACLPPADLAVPLDRDDEVSFGLDVVPYRCQDGEHGFRLRAFVVDADALPEVPLDADRRERIASALALVIGER